MTCLNTVSYQYVISILLPWTPLHQLYPKYHVVINCSLYQLIPFYVNCFLQIVIYVLEHKIYFVVRMSVASLPLRNKTQKLTAWKRMYFSDTELNRENPFKKLFFDESYRIIVWGIIINVYLLWTSIIKDTFISKNYSAKETLNCSQNNTDRFRMMKKDFKFINIGLIYICSLNF